MQRVLLLLPLLWHVFGESALNSCQQKCTVLIPPSRRASLPDVDACWWKGNDGDGRFTANSLYYCPSTSTLLFQCLKASGYGVVQVGPCGCPNNCWPDGQCSNGTHCECHSSNKNNNRSLKKLDDGCPGDHQVYDGGASFSGATNPGNEYSPWDQYGFHHPLFNQSTVTQVHVQVAPQHLLFLLDPANQQNREFFPATARFSNEAIDVVVPCRFRTKGDGSRAFMKKSWKLKLEKPLFQQKKISFKACEMEPSFLREISTLNMLAAQGALAYRGSHYQLFINGQLFGSYVGLEDIGKRFIRSRFADDGSKGGASLFKSQGLLKYFGPLEENRATYEDKYQQKVGEPAALSALVDLLQVINTTAENGDDDLSAVEKMLDVDMFLRTYAIEVMTGNWDGILNSGNYILMTPPNSSRFIYFRFDLDSSLGAPNTLPGRGGNFSTRNIFNWTQWEKHNKPTNNPLVPLLMKSPKWRQVYINRLQAASEYLQRPTLKQTLHAQLAYIKRLVLADRWRSIDYLWSNSSFLGSLDDNLDLGGTPFLGINNFLSARIEATAKQIAQQQV